MLINGQCICEKCGNIMGWEYQVRDKRYAFQPDRMDWDKYHPEAPVKMQNGDYLFTLECKECGAITQFTFTSDIFL